MKITKLKHMKDGSRSFLILAHKDLDGAISAALLFKKIREEYDQIHVMFVGCHGLSRLGNLSRYSNVGMVDLGLNGDCAFSFYRFIQNTGADLEYIFDHHIGWDIVLERANRNCLKNFNIYSSKYRKFSNYSKVACIQESASSCGQVIRDFFSLDDQYSKDLAQISVISDDLSYKSTDERLLRAYSKLKMMVLPLALKEAALKDNIDQFDDPDPNTYKFMRLSRQGELVTEAFDNIVEVAPGIGYISEVKSRNIDASHLYSKAYEKYKVLIIKELNVKKFSAYFIVGHNIKGLDLTKVFNLKVGNPRKVVLHRSGSLNVEKVVDRLTKYVS